jgi:hypothetical protein
LGIRWREFNYVGIYRDKNGVDHATILLMPNLFHF